MDPEDFGVSNKYIEHFISRLYFFKYLKKFKVGFNLLFLKMRGNDPS